MAYLLIVLGIAALVSGIVLLTVGNNSNTSEPVYDMSRSYTKAQSGYASQSSSARRDTVIVVKEVPQVVEKVVEKVVEVQVERTTEKPTDGKTAAETSKSKGDDFENFVVNLLADKRLKLLDRTQDKKSSVGVYAESCKNPDLHIGQKRGKSDVDYYVECKYRSNWIDGAVTFEDWQINRYRKFQRTSHRKVLIALGVGGTASRPATFRLVPLDSISDNAIREIDTEYDLTPTSSTLIAYIDDYFTTVFRRSREKKGSSKD